MGKCGIVAVEGEDTLDGESKSSPSVPPSELGGNPKRHPPRERGESGKEKPSIDVIGGLFVLGVWG